MMYLLYVSPIICALIGWCVHIIAIRFMIFSNSNRMRMSQQIGRLAAAEFANLNLEQKIGDPANFQKLTPFIENHVDDFLRNKLKEQMPMISMFIGDKTITTMKTVFMKELEGLFPQVMKQFAVNLKNDAGIEQIVTARLANLSSEQFEKMLAKPLRTAGFLGMVTGFVVGCFQVLLLVLLLFNM